MYKQIIRRKKEISVQIARLKETISKFLEGHIICTRNKKYYKWYHSKNGEIRYIPKKEKKLAEQLALKKYHSLKLEKLFAEEQAVNAYLKKYNQENHFAEKQFLEDPEYCKLIAPFFKPISKELEEWIREPYQKNENYPEKLIHKTQSGFYVRSKSEALIAMILYKNRIPFRYECMLRLGETILYPDFTIRHPKTGKLYYWEHFGLMDDDKYCKNVYSKMQIYSQNGIIPSIHLITTFETKEHPLDIELVEKIVEYCFLE